jgi:2-amino-4-hydroxy-6-hydroxymethyldihydropteridine diphosphokinase
MDDHSIYLVLGSNIDPEHNLPLAIEILGQLVRVEKVSSVWETRAVGSSGPNFLNLAVKIRSSLTPDALKHLILRNIEVQLGRKRTENKNAPRTIDIDIVIIDDKVVDDHVWHNAHMALPLAELIPELLIKSEGESLKQASERLSRIQTARRRTDLKVDQKV